MLNGLGRQCRWRDVTDEMPSRTGNVLVAQYPGASPLYGDSVPVCRAAYWDGREFRRAETGLLIRGVTHWMPYPDLPSEEAMRRVFRALLARDMLKQEAEQC